MRSPHVVACRRTFPTVGWPRKAWQITDIRRKVMSGRSACYCGRFSVLEALPTLGYLRTNWPNGCYEMRPIGILVHRGPATKFMSWCSTVGPLIPGNDQRPGRFPIDFARRCCSVRAAPPTPVRGATLGQQRRMDIAHRAWADTAAARTIPRRPFTHLTWPSNQHHRRDPAPSTTDRLIPPK